MNTLNPISSIFVLQSLYYAHTSFLVDVLGLSLKYIFETQIKLVYTYPMKTFKISRSDLSRGETHDPVL